MDMKLPFSTTGMMLHIDDSMDYEVLSSSIESMPKSDKTEDEIAAYMESGDAFTENAMTAWDSAREELGDLKKAGSAEIDAIFKSSKSSSTYLCLFSLM